MKKLISVFESKQVSAQQQTECERQVPQGFAGTASAAAYGELASRQEAWRINASICLRLVQLGSIRQQEQQLLLWTARSLA